MSSKETSDGKRTFPVMTVGSNDAADPATTGYFINHLCINVRDVTRSIDFYTTVFGMRHMFTIQLSQHVSVVYLGHSHGGKNGVGYQTAEELIRQKNNTEGLLELLHVDVPSNQDLPASTKVPNTFSHIGIIVPDIKATQSRLEAYGVTIHKPTGDPLPTEGPVANASGFGNLAELEVEERDAVVGVLNALNAAFIFAVDPDGNMLEIQPQEETR